LKPTLLPAQTLEAAAPKLRRGFPFFWQPRGTVPALENLPLNGGVLRPADVTEAVTGANSQAHRLMVTALAGGKIIGDLRLATTNDDVVIGNIQSVFGAENLNRHYALQQRRFRLYKYRKGTALLLGASNSDNYYHWLVESLPRWRLLQAAGWQDYDYVLLHSQPSSFQEETLDWAGVPKERRLRCSKHFIHQFETLVVPAMPAARKTVPTWVAPWLRSLPPHAWAGAEKVYLSRRGAPGRWLVNEPELQTALDAYGIVTAQPERLTVAGQARLCGSARWIIGPHGAALANMVFAAPGAKVVEFFHPQHKNQCYERLAAACGHDYASLDGRATNQAGDRRLEYAVDVAAVCRTLDSLETHANHPRK
jgi:hypothetical protein